MTVFLLLATGLFVMALYGVFASRNVLRRILALNVLSTAVFLWLVTVARLAPELDPVPHAMVLTGIVVTVSTTAVAVALAVRLQAPDRGSKGS
ncbi:cation:proton antiporter subunit C [Thioalkalivibrio sulfidiphilus]|uniref:cation:proton antiporter subunit C n=1 Tax=Thioalkalivibrio sulfidiphilus TaxID=1033854 RepID=UPI000378852E|nr:cation:proton antiporter subunit C [Thioalkalivibrio sulfidiphilus]